MEMALRAVENLCHSPAMIEVSKGMDLEKSLDIRQR